MFVGLLGFMADRKLHEIMPSVWVLLAEYDTKNF